MNTELAIDGALIILAALYLWVGVRWFRWSRRDKLMYDKHLAEIEKTAARARQLRELVQERFWS